MLWGRMRRGWMGVTVDAPEKLTPEFSDSVSETLLIPLWARALEQQEAEPLVVDPIAAEIAARLDYDWNRIRLSRNDLAQCVVRLREFDRFAREFMARNPSATVVHLGCGLDTRFQRVDDGAVRWFDLDLPDVIALREQLVPETERDRYLRYSAFDERWMDAVGGGDGAFLFIAEAMLVYFDERQVRGLFLALQERFSGAEVVTDTFTPLMIGIDNLHLVITRSAARLRWGLRDPADVEGWNPGIRLEESFSYFDDPEPRMGFPSWISHVRAITEGTGIRRYRLDAPPSSGA